MFGEPFLEAPIQSVDDAFAASLTGGVTGTGRATRTAGSRTQTRQSARGDPDESSAGQRRRTAHTGQAGPAFVDNVEVVDATPRRVILHLRYPIQLLPLLVFESLWKLIWLVAVGVPHLMAGDMDAQMSSVFFSVSLAVIILAVTAWDYVWKQHVRALVAHWR